MRKPELAGIVIQARHEIRKALGVPKHQAPDDSFYTCPFGHEEDVHRIDLDEESGNWYCMDCHAGYEEAEKHLSRLDELWRVHHLDEATYEGGKPRPVRKNQKITDGELEDFFKELEGQYVKVDRLKKMFGPTPDNPDGLIKINDTDSSTTIISSSFMRRLGKITGKRWTQEKAEGEKGENLVRFVETERTYAPKKKPSLDEKYRNLITKEKIYKKLYESRKDIVDYFDDRGEFTEFREPEEFDFEKNVHYKYIRSDAIEFLKSEIKYVENLEDLLGKEAPKDKDSEKIKDVLLIIKKKVEKKKNEGDL
jgi:hypothetical protein